MNPSIRPLAKLLLLIAIALGLIFSTPSNATAQDTIRVMHYNLLNFPNTGAPNRQDTMKRMLQYYLPDVLMVCELQDATGADALLNSALNTGGINYYQRAAFVENQSGTNNLQNMIYYNSNKLTLLAQDEILTTVRDINEYTLYYIEALTGDTVFIDFYESHLKAADGSANAALRKQAVDSLMAHLSTTDPTHYRVFGGDLNVYNSSESGYQALLTAGPVFFNDPINTPGSWHNNAAYTSVHTQSTRTTSFGGGATGGMDDRFDFLLISDNIDDGLGKVQYIPSSYESVGQDGNHFNQAINDGVNLSVPADVLSSLYQSSDHLPVTMLLELSGSIDTVPPPPPPSGGCGDLYFSEYIEGSSNNKALEIYNSTGADADLSAYSVSVFNNGSTTATNSVALSGTLANATTYNIVNSSADAALTGLADIFSAVTFFNGDDAVALYKGGVLIDVIGVIGVDPGTEWTVGSGSTGEYTLIRKASVKGGETDWVIGATTWDVFPQDYFAGFGTHTQDPCTPACSDSLQPGGLYNSVGATEVTLGWDSIPGAVKCEVNGRVLGTTSFAKLRVDVPPYQAAVPMAALTPGASYEWKIRCACQLSPVIATDFSVLDTFFVPLLRETTSIAEVGVRPNPVFSKLYINWQASVDGPVQIAISDLSGRIINSTTALSVAGANQLEMDLSHFNSGLYVVHIQANGEKIVEKVTVLH